MVIHAYLCRAEGSGWVREFPGDDPLRRGQIHIATGGQDVPVAEKSYTLRFRETERRGKWCSATQFRRFIRRRLRGGTRHRTAQRCAQKVDEPSVPRPP